VKAALQHCDSRAARPGSGKSTFCQSLMQRSHLMWERVNQDTIADGRCGARNLPVPGLRRAHAGCTRGCSAARLGVSACTPVLEGRGPAALD